MPARRTTTDSSEALKEAVVEAALARVAETGFTDKLLKLAAEDAGIDPARMNHLFPQGIASLLETYSARTDQEMVRRLKDLKLSGLPVRRRIATAIKTRLDILRPHKDAVRRSVAWLSLPPNVPLGAKLVYCTVDAMWRAAGDLSTDFNFYTKRGILAGVYSSTVMRWLTDASDDEHETEAFLDARIENVMQFEKLKAGARSGLKTGLDRMGEIFRAARGGT